MIKFYCKKLSIKAHKSVKSKHLIHLEVVRVGGLWSAKIQIFNNKEVLIYPHDSSVLFS